MSQWCVSCPLISLVLGHVGDIGEAVRVAIPFERVSTTTYLYDAYESTLLECDQKLEAQLGRLYRYEAPAEPGKRRGRRRNAAKFDLRTALLRVCGVDLTRIDGIETGTALKVIAEVGPDLARFKSAKRFCSWLGLCQGTEISGGKVLSGATKRTANRLAQALRLAAAALRTSQSALGAYYRRLCGRRDKAKAVKATAHKLARLIYTMLTKGTEYVDRGQDYYEERYACVSSTTSTDEPPLWVSH